MAKDRITPCEFYICEHECSKNRKAEYSGYCQKCDKYIPRAREKHLNRKKEEIQRIRNKEF